MVSRFGFIIAEAVKFGISSPSGIHGYETAAHLWGKYLAKQLWSCSLAAARLLPSDHGGDAKAERGIGPQRGDLGLFFSELSGLSGGGETESGFVWVWRSDSDKSALDSILRFWLFRLSHFCMEKLRDSEQPRSKLTGKKIFPKLFFLVDCCFHFCGVFFCFSLTIQQMVKRKYDWSSS